MTLEQITAKIEELHARAQELLTKAEGSDNTEEIAGIKAMVENELQPEITRLQEERATRERDEEKKALQGRVTTLEATLEELRKPMPNFNIGGKAPVAGDQPNAYADGKHSFYADVKAANKGRQEALERLNATEGKAMTEGTDAQGGYLVQTDIERRIVTARESDNIIRALASKINVNTDSIQLDQISLGTTAGWVAELGVKPESTSLSLTSVSAQVFTAAGLATISNQLLADSNPAVDNLVTADLAKRLVALEETAFLVGTGTGQPLGLLNTPGTTATSITDTGITTTGGLLDKVLDSILQVQTDHGNPTAIVLHPRTWTRIIKTKDAQGAYVLGSEGFEQARPQAGTLFGVPVRLSNRIPINSGAGTNESRVIVGDFSEALVLDRQGIAVDESPHVYFTTNQTVFRAEQRVGFTAARNPKAFAVIGGAGLANG